MNPIPRTASPSVADITSGPVPGVCPDRRERRDTPAGPHRATGTIRRRAARRLPHAGLALVALGLLGSCSERDDNDVVVSEGGGGGDVPALDGGSCELDSQLAWLEGSMRDYYLFYDQVPTVRRSEFASAEQLLLALRVPPDDFSFITDAARNTALIEEGQRVGYGWRLALNDDGAIVLRLVEAGSPLDLAGARRGDLIRTVNGRGIRTFTPEEADEVLGVDEEIVTVTMGIESSDGVLREVEVTRSQYTVLGVQQLEVMPSNGVNVGYMNFLTFIEPARAELDQAFATLKEANVNELVLDLRFNGGGRIDVANELASRIGGEGVQGRDFSRFRFNDKETRVPATGLPQPFVSLVDSLDLARVYVLTGPGTCSASEMVINGLEPFVDVVQIGQSTCGKPFGFQPNERCGQALFAVEIEFVNDSGVGGYVDGLAPDCVVLPDDSSPLGTGTEPLFAAALQHIDTATCPAVAANAGQTLATRDRSAGDPRYNPADPFSSDLIPR